MESNMKPSTWDLNEFNQEKDPYMPTLIGTGPILGRESKDKFSVDLKLGRLRDLGDGSTDKFKNSKSLMLSSPTGSSKRARPLNGTQNVSCLVDGCNSDLSNCREYHRRHRVCERHSKTPVVIVAGREQRFCQQCSRFHSLGEFDDVKRSCRKRLDGHNRRRRKSQPESFYMGSGKFLSNHQGAGLLQFGSSQMHSSRLTWPRITGSEEEAMIYDDWQQLPAGLIPFASSIHNIDQEFPLLQSNQTEAPEVVFDIPAKNGSASHGLTQPASSEVALSLLSSPATQFSGMSFAHLVQANATPSVQTSNAMFHMESSGLSENGLP